MLTHGKCQPTFIRRVRECAATRKWCLASTDVAASRLSVLSRLSPLADSFPMTFKARRKLELQLKNFQNETHVAHSSGTAFTSRLMKWIFSLQQFCYLVFSSFFVFFSFLFFLDTLEFGGYKIVINSFFERDFSLLTASINVSCVSWSCLYFLTIMFGTLICLWNFYRNTVARIALATGSR